MIVERPLFWVSQSGWKESSTLCDEGRNVRMMSSQDERTRNNERGGE